MKTETGDKDSEGEEEWERERDGEGEGEKEMPLARNVTLIANGDETRLSTDTYSDG